MARTRIGLRTAARTAPAAFRAAPPAEAKPFLKWAGGKRQLLDRIRPMLPSRFGAYHEPFVGGGALFFDLAPRRAHLGDTNERLVRAYRGIRDHVDTVVELLRSYPYERGFFERMREAPVDSFDDAGVAAWFVYLNKTGFNGLYRVNRANRFNVPFGRYANPTICDEENLRACSAALAGACVEVEGFDAVLGRARRGDLVYFDPPYVPLSATSSFTSYTAAGFGHPEQERLRDVALELKRRGVHVVLSNSSAPAVKALYGEAFELVPVPASRAISCRGEGRGKVTELLIR